MGATASTTETLFAGPIAADPGRLVLTLLALVSVVLVVLLARRPALISGRGGGVLAFVAFLLLPALVTAMGLATHLENSKSTEFCLSCHEMKPYGNSLLVDSDEHVAANHFQNKRIPRDQACYTCHTTYTMFGDLEAKLKGLEHLRVHYFGTLPETLELYEPYSNRECLSCHRDARSYEEDETHADLRAELATDEISCLECHTPTHGVDDLGSHGRWRGEQP